MPDDTRIAVLVLFTVPPRQPRGTDLESLMELRRLAYDLDTEGIRLIPFPPGPPWDYPYRFPRDIDEFEELLERGRFDWSEFDYWWLRWMRDWPEPAERWWRYYREFLPETLRGVQRLIERRLVNGVVLLTSTGFGEEPMEYELQQISKLFPPRAGVNPKRETVEIGTGYDSPQNACLLRCIVARWS